MYNKHYITNQILFVSVVSEWWDTMGYTNYHQLMASWTSCLGSAWVQNHSVTAKSHIFIHIFPIPPRRNDRIRNQQIGQTLSPVMWPFLGNNGKPIDSVTSNMANWDPLTLRRETDYSFHPPCSRWTFRCTNDQRALDPPRTILIQLEPALASQVMAPTGSG